MPFADIKQIMLISYHYMLLINKLVKKYNFKRKVAARNFIFLRFKIRMKMNRNQSFLKLFNELSFKASVGTNFYNNL